MLRLVTVCRPAKVFLFLLWASRRLFCHNNNNNNNNNNNKMEFGLDKCAKATFKRGKLTETSDLQLDIDTCIKELDQEDTYKYLGVDEGDGTQHAR